MDHHLSVPSKAACCCPCSPVRPPAKGVRGNYILSSCYGCCFWLMWGWWASTLLYRIRCSVVAAHWKTNHVPPEFLNLHPHHHHQLTTTISSSLLAVMTVTMVVVAAAAGRDGGGDGHIYSAVVLVVVFKLSYQTHVPTYLPVKKVSALTRKA